MNTITTPDKTGRRGGRRELPAEVRAARVRRVRAILDLGYSHDIAHRRTRTTIATARKWAAELGIKFNY
jgi:hypothetical protein